MDSLYLLIGSFINALVVIYSSYVILNKKFKISNNLVIILTFSLYIALSYIFTHNILRTIISTIILCLIIKYKLNNNFYTSTITTLLTVFIMVISELIYLLIIIILFNGKIIVVRSQFETCFATIIISTIIYLIVDIPLFKKMYQYVLGREYNYNFQDVLNIVISAIIFLILVYINIFEINKINRLLITIIVIILLLSINILLIVAKIKNSFVTDDLDLLLNKTEDYKMMYDEERILNHEHKNDLLIMLNTQNLEEIHNFIKEKLSLTTIPLKENLESLNYLSDNLKYMLYYKIKFYERQNKEVILNVSENINLKLSNKEINYLYKLLNIYLDNAKDASNKIYINILNDDYLYIKINNKFNNSIIEKSTKDSKRGYGFKIAKYILKRSKYIKVKRVINGNEYNVIIQIKM